MGFRHVRDISPQIMTPTLGGLINPNSAESQDMPVIAPEYTSENVMNDLDNLVSFPL